jgi:AcrR family transcriptional regulator
MKRGERAVRAAVEQAAGTAAAAVDRAAGTAAAAVDRAAGTATTREAAVFARARSAEHKQHRRDAILAAARDLAAREGVQGVTLAAVADAVGLAKSNVLRYFGTREEIYLELMVGEWGQWAAELTERLPAPPLTSEALASALTGSLTSRPLFCDLQSVLATSLERHVGLEAARTYKRAALAALESAGSAMAERSALTAMEGFELAAASTVFAGMIWPMAHPAAVLRELYAEEPELARACPPFEPTLERLIRTLAEGFTAVREDSPDSAPT